MSGLRDGPCSHAEAQELLPEGQSLVLVKARQQVAVQQIFDGQVENRVAFQNSAFTPVNFLDSRISHSPENQRESQNETA